MGDEEGSLVELLEKVKVRLRARERLVDLVSSSVEGRRSGPAAAGLSVLDAVVVVVEEL